MNLLKLHCGLIIWILIATVAAVCGGELLTNPSFEDVDGTVPRNWVLQGAAGRSDGVIKQHGGQSFQIRVEGIGEGVATQEIAPLQPGDVVEFASSIRTKDADGARIGLDFIDEQGKKISGFESEESVNGTTFEETWKLISVRATVPSEAVGGRLRLKLRGGTAWFDSAVLKTGLGGQNAETFRRPSFLKEADFTEPAMKIEGGNIPASELWVSDSEEVKKDSSGNYLVLRPGQSLRTKNVYPEGSVSMRVAFRDLPSHHLGFAGFGLRRAYGTRPRVTFSIEGFANELRQGVEDLEGRSALLPAVPLDDAFHDYTFVRESDEVVMRVDGKETGRVKLDGLKMEPVEVSVYNELKSGEILVDDVEIRLAKEDFEHLPSFQKTSYVFREVPHREISPWKPTSTDLRQGMVVFQRNISELLFSNSLPREGEPLNHAQAAGCPGEKEGLLLGLHAFEALRGVNISASDLRSDKGAILKGETVNIGRVREIPKRHLYAVVWTKDYSRMPMIIEPWKDADLAQNSTLGVWLDVTLPADCAPGLYQGTLKVTSEQRTFSVPFKITVYPFTLAKPQGMFFGVYAPSLNTYPPDNPELKENLREMVDSGMTSIGYCDAWAALHDEGGEVAVKFDITFQMLMENYFNLGFTEPVLQIRDSLQDYAYALDAKGRISFDEAYQDAAKSVHEALAPSWPKMYLQPIDEPSWSGADAQKRNLLMLKLLKSQNLFLTALDGPVDRYFLEDAGPYADMWVGNGEIPVGEELTKARMEGKKVLIYNTDVESWRPVVTRYSAGYFQWKYQLDGVFQWEYQSRTSVSRAYNEVEGDIEVGYMAYVYPKYRDNSGGPTIAWRAFREGIDDYRYLLTLQKAMDEVRAKKPAEVKDIEGKLEAMMASLHDTPRLRNVAAWSAAGEEDGKPFIAGIYNIPNGWQPRDYDRNRQVIASWIMDLQKN